MKDKQKSYIDDYIDRSKITLKIKSYLQFLGVLELDGLKAYENIFIKGKLSMTEEEKIVWNQMTDYEKKVYFKKYYDE